MPVRLKRKDLGQPSGSGLVVDAVSAVVDGSDGVSGEVGEGVVAWADEDEVLEVGGAAVGPAFLPVVGIGPGGGALAVLDRADPFLLEVQGEALGGGGGPVAPAEVEDLAFAVQDRGQHPGGAGQPAGGAGREVDP